MARFNATWGNFWQRGQTWYHFWGDANSASPPTVALNTPTDGFSTSVTTPALNFTGTDAEGDALEYEVQIDTVNSFDSQIGTPALIDSYPSSNRDASAGMYMMGYEKFGQTFQSNGTRITSVKFALYRSGTPSGYCSVWLYALNGGPGTFTLASETPLATSDGIDVSTINNVAWTITSFTFSGTQRYQMTNGTWYAVALVYNSGGNASNKILIGFDSTSSTHSGRMLYYAGGWTFSVSGTIFYVYGASTIGPIITALSASNAGFTAGHPFASGTAIDYTVQSALSLILYFWRVRAKDPSGTNTFGAWSDTYSFTVTTFMGYPIKYWTGSSFDIKPLKYYTGSMWTTKPIKCYNGATWDTLSN